MTDDEAKRDFDNASLARIVGQALKNLSDHNAGLVLGMWNPAFCSASAEYHAREIQEDLQRFVDRIKSRRASNALAD